MTQQYAPGITLLGRYVVDSLLGAGGMGEVYVVHHIELSRKRFAAKTLRAEVFGLEDIDARFRREAEVLAALEHPGIVSLVDFGMEGKTPVMVMELLQGETLRDRITHRGPMALGECARIVHDVASALAYTHAANPPVVHRDLKPENLFLVAPDDRVKVLDFGIAKVLGLETGITQTRTALGTPNYMAPEQLRDSATVDPRADQFALASIAFECLTTQLAYPGDGIGGVVLAIFDGARPRACATRSDVPASVDAVLAKAWSLEAVNRYSDVKTFSDALNQALSEGASLGTANTSPATHAARNDQPLTPTRIGASFSRAQASAESTPVTPRASSRMPIVIGGLIALAAVGVGGVIAWRSSAPTTNATVPASVAVPMHPDDPSLPPHERIGTDPVIAGNPTAAGTEGPIAPTNDAPNVFESVASSLADPIRRCGNGALGGERTISVRVTWAGSMGLPQNIAFEGATLPTSVRGCIGSAIAAYGRIPPQRERSVTRTMHFVVQ